MITIYLTKYESFGSEWYCLFFVTFDKGPEEEAHMAQKKIRHILACCTVTPSNHFH